MKMNTGKLLSIAIITLAVGFLVTYKATFVYGEEGLHVKEGGNVGIGTTNPGELLELYKTSKPALRFLNGTVEYNQFIDTSNNMHFGSPRESGDVANDTRPFVLTGSGNVGIGTTAPGAKLDIAATTGQTSDLFLTSGGGKVGLTYLDQTDHFNLINYQSSGNASLEQGIAFFTNGDTVAPKVYFSRYGNVGIGTTNPLAKVHVAGNILLGTSVTPTRYLGLSDPGGGVWNGALIEFDTTAAPSTKINFITHNNGVGSARRLTIDKVGNVGIGVTSPSYKLHVNGTAYATGASGALSDIRHKKNVHSISDGALKIIENLRPVTYEWKNPADSGMEGTQIGFIAQEVEKFLPEVVLTQDDEDKTKALKFNEFIPVLVKAMQEVKEENQTLKAENEQLRNTLASLTDRQTTLEEMFLAISTTFQKEKLAKLGDVRE